MTYRIKKILKFKINLKVTHLMISKSDSPPQMMINKQMHKISSKNKTVIYPMMSMNLNLNIRR